jgi:hypothetical protein
VTYVTQRSSDGNRSDFHVGRYAGRDRKGRVLVEHGGKYAPAWTVKVRPDFVVVGR